MGITPYLYYEDVDAAIAFLAKAFGMRIHGRRMKDRDGKTNHAAMKSGADMVMMGRPPQPTFRNPKHLGQATQSLLINVTGIDKHFERARAAGAVILEEPHDTPFGARRYGVTDPEGHEWYFAQAAKRPVKKKKAPRR